jgi:DNA repair exonuclease SbcCD nuclease subunit
MKFIHAADIHLDSPLKGLDVYEGAPVDEIRGATRRALERLVELAIDEAVDFVVIAGDLYDGDWRDHNTGLFMVRQMARLREAQIPVFTVRGNHDAENKMTTSLRMPENVTLLSSTKPQTKTLKHLDVAIHGRSFAQAAEVDNLAAAYPAGDRKLFNIGLLHTSLDGREGHASYAPCNLDDLKSKNYQYWALGHVHTREDTLLSDPPIVFPGNVQGRHIRECGAKGCELVHVDDQHRVRVEFRPLDVLRWQHVKIDCSSAERADDVIDLCRQTLARELDAADGLPLAARVDLRGATSAHTRLLARPLDWASQIRATAIDAGDGRIWIEKVKFHTTPAGALDDLAGDGPIAELVGYVRSLQAHPEELAELAADLAPLVAKLPGELLTGDDSLALDRPQRITELLREVEPLLVERLQKQEACT